MTFTDRAEAGRALAKSLDYLRETRPLVLGLPRGGVPVAAQVAAELGTDLDIILVRKLGVPWQPELAMGAISEDGGRVLNPDVVHHARISRITLEDIEVQERIKLERRSRVLRADGRRIAINGRTVVIVDDGVATGATAIAACALARAEGARWIVVAVPIGPPDVVRRLGAVADEVVCLVSPADMGGVGAANDDFHQLADREVTDLLDEHRTIRGKLDRPNSNS
ncbi:phosphoribosyltransferase [Antrihabitans spumae]|uniref:Phosphoribosyltransferase n=1 Tax=Antrihabitans spumae TaxID=3373370 RepID=A0ABW7K6T7_9NOCA